MSEFIVCSDNHGRIPVLQKIREKYANIPTKIHCGDIELPNAYMEGFYAVSGNNDFFYHYPDHLIVELDDLRIYVTHGDEYFRDRKEKLRKKAINNHCQVICYGHTHIFDVEEMDGVLLINPGSLSYNRDGSDPSYVYVKYENGEFELEKRYVKDL